MSSAINHVEASWNVMVHAQKPDFVFRAKRMSPFKSPGPSVQSTAGSRGVRTAVVMLDTSRSEVVWRVLATHCIRKFPLHLPSRGSLCAIKFQLEPTYCVCVCVCVCVFKYVYIYFHEIFFPIHQCIFRWNCVQSSRYSAPSVFIIANTLHVSVHVYSVSHSLPVVIIRHAVYSLWIWMEMWDKQMICWYEANIGNCSGADGDNVGRNFYVKKTYVGKCAFECSWLRMAFDECVVLSSFRLSGCCTL